MFALENEEEHQGLVRTVKNAHLVYKRIQPNGNFEELWIYNTTYEYNSALAIQKDILSGTDIQVNNISLGNSPDNENEPSYTATSMGDVVLIHIINLPQ